MGKKVIVIGGGPGGYVAAIRAAQFGATVDLVEAEKLGGTCLNAGCIPTKVLLHTAELYQAIRGGSTLGIRTENVRVDWPALLSRKKQVVRQLVNGVDSLLRANGVTVHKGRAVLQGERTVEVNGGRLTGDVLILAMGSEPVRVPLPGADLPGVIDSTQALELKEVPETLLILGGGVVGIEFAAVYSAFGSKVTVVEMLPEILPPFDREIAAQIRAELSRKGVAFLTGAGLSEIKKQEKQLMAKISTNGSVRELPCDTLLMAVGRKARLGNSGIEAAGIATGRGYITVNMSFQTNIPGIYAIGDCNGQNMLAHAASAQGVAAVEHALGHTSAYYPQTIPACVYTSPAAAGVGLTEEQAVKQKLAYKKGVFPLSGNGKSVIENGGTGLVKVLSGKTHGEIIGVHIFGPHAFDLIAEAALAIRLEATVDELISTIHAHPTVSEAMAEAALAVDGAAIHWPPPR